MLKIVILMDVKYLSTQVIGDAQDLSVFIDLAESLKTQKSFGFLVGRGNRNASLRKGRESKIFR